MVNQPISETVIPVGFKREVVEVPHKEYPTQPPRWLGFLGIAGVALLLLVMVISHNWRRNKS